MSRYAWRSWIDDSRHRRHIGVMTVIAVLAALAGVLTGFTGATVLSNPFEACNLGGFRNARIAWGEVEQGLAAPDASADVVETLTAEIQTVYRADGTMDMQALQSLLTPELREVTGMDCSQMGTPSAPGPALSGDRQAYLDQVRQVDAQTVSAFIVLPNRMFQAAPGASPVAVGIANGTPLPGTEIVDAVQFAIFVNQNGVWKLDYLSFGSMVVFSDVAPIGQAPSDGFIGSWGYSAADLREHGMPSVPEGSEVIASPVASPMASPTS